MCNKAGVCKHCLGGWYPSYSLGKALFLYYISFCPACIGLFMITGTEMASCFPDKLDYITQ